MTDDQPPPHAQLADSVPTFAGSGQQRWLQPVTEVALRRDCDADYIRVNVVLALDRTRAEIGGGLVGLLREGCRSLAVVWNKRRTHQGMHERVLRRHLDDLVVDITTTLADDDRAWAAPADELWFDGRGRFSWEGVPRDWDSYKPPALRVVD